VSDNESSVNQTVQTAPDQAVSMPSRDVFDHQPREYRDAVLPPAVKARVAVEQASTFGWERYVGPRAGSSACRPSAPPPR